MPNQIDALNELLKDKTFINWFSNSEMVDGGGKPMIFYHGSNSEFVVFDKSKIGSATDPGWLGEGFYFYTDIHEAMQYGKVRAYLLNIESPYMATAEENDELANANNIKASRAFTQMVRNNGYDGVYYNGNLRGETVVFEPNQIWKLNVESDDIEI